MRIGAGKRRNPKCCGRCDALGGGVVGGAHPTSRNGTGIAIGTRPLQVGALGKANSRPRRREDRPITWSPGTGRWLRRRSDCSDAAAIWRSERRVTACYVTEPASSYSVTAALHFGHTDHVGGAPAGNVRCRGRLFDSRHAARARQSAAQRHRRSPTSTTTRMGRRRETLTWSQLYRRMLNVGEEISAYGSPGDRALILAPQGLEYVVGFLGALQAGLIAVPLSVPHGGAHDERRLRCWPTRRPPSSSRRPPPSTTSTRVRAVAAGRNGAVDRRSRSAGPRCARGDPGPSRARRRRPDDTAYLQYTSGSTRTPAGVMVSQHNLFANFEQIMADFFATTAGCPAGHHRGVLAAASTTTWASDLGIVMPILAGIARCSRARSAFLQRPARWMQLLATQRSRLSRRRRTSLSNWRRARPPTRTWPASISADVLTILTAASGSSPATLKRFTDGSPSSILPAKVLRPSYGLAEATVYIATRKSGEPPKIVHFDAEKLSAGQAKRCRRKRHAAGQLRHARSRRWCASSIPRPRSSVRRERSVRSGCTATTSRRDTGRNPKRPSTPSARDRQTRRTAHPRGLGCEPGTGLRLRRRTVHRGPHQGPADRLRAQPLSRRHRGDDPGDHRGPLRGDRGSGDGIEKLVAIIEIKRRGTSRPRSWRTGCGASNVKSPRRSSKSHGLSVADLVLVSPGSIPITTSGKIRRAQCVEMYRKQGVRPVGRLTNRLRHKREGLHHDQASKPARIPLLPLDEAKAAADEAGVPDYMAELSIFQALLNHPRLARVFNDLLATMLWHGALDRGCASW